MNQKTIIAILSIAVLVLLCTTIYFATKKDADEKTSDSISNQLENQKTNDDEEQVTTISDSQKYIEVRELGVKIPVDDLSADEIVYKIYQNTGYNARFSAKSLNAISKDCEDGSIGSIMKVDGNASTDSNSESFIPGEIKQFKDFAIIFMYPQAPCHSGDVSLDNKFMKILHSGFEDAVLIE